VRCRGLDHVGFLLRLVELELIDRERRMVERRIKEARFPAVKVSYGLSSAFLVVVVGSVGKFAPQCQAVADLGQPSPPR
jgi:hypothetical protein